MLLHRCNVHTLLRLPTGIWYSPGVKANVLFFDKTPVSPTPATQDVWVYDLRSNRNFSLRQTPIQPKDLADFIRSYSASNPARRKETPHFRRFKYPEIIARDKANLDIQWHEEPVNPKAPDTPHGLMKEIFKDLQEAMTEFAAAESEIMR
jgi:type I restriction enzyme M protein